jgi:hypothetical protein
LKLLWRILLIVFATLVVVFVGVRWLAPAALSYYEAYQALALTHIVPTELRDNSVSQAPGKKVSISGYEFEVPWTDMDEGQTKLYPKAADLRFRSGLRVVVTAISPREWVDGLAEQMKVSPERIQAAFGQSDYDVLKTIYEFSPDKMHHWNPQVLAREQFLLILKTAAPLPSAKSGIFNMRDSDLRGFQEGSPQVRQDGIAVHLFANDGSIEFIFSQRDYRDTSGITQPEINRIVHSVRKIQAKTPAQPRNN